MVSAPAQSPFTPGVLLAALIATIPPQWARAQELTRFQSSRVQEQTVPSLGQALETTRLVFRLELTPQVLAYGLPDHPLLKGKKQVGTISHTVMDWAISDTISLQGGVLARLPFAYNLNQEARAFPILSFTLQRVLGPDTLFRLGSLDIHHGFHRAILDEWRYQYMRNYQETYNQSLVPAARRDLGGDVFLPAEQGGQFIYDTAAVHSEVYLDWQFLETGENREKFAVGALWEVDRKLFVSKLQFRVVHYGGQIYTHSDPIRFAGLDPVREPISTVALVALRPYRSEPFSIEIPVAWIAGNVIQIPGQTAELQSGTEAGIDLTFSQILRMGYRIWLPISRPYGYVSEDGDPFYAGRRQHRAILQGKLNFGPATLSSEIDIGFPRGSGQVQYETLTSLDLVWETLLSGDTHYPPG